MNYGNIIHNESSRDLNSKSGVVGRSRHVASVPSPVGVDEFAWIAEQLVRVGSEVISLGLDEVGWDMLRPVGE